MLHYFTTLTLFSVVTVAVTSGAIDYNKTASLTIIPGQHVPKQYPFLPAAKSSDDLFESSCTSHFVSNKTDIIKSSFDQWDFSASQTYPSSASLIRSAVEAWGRHSHLVLRPDDLWFTILTQMSFYMESHHKAVRHIFVSHADKEKIVVENTTWDLVIAGFRDGIQSRIKTKWMADWISPGFTTSTHDDELTATVLMMGMMKAYFDYLGGIICGIPSVTLLGTKQDWQRLMDKVDRIDSFGKDAAPYKRRLIPILRRVVASFDDPSSTQTRDFWDQMVQARQHHSVVCGEPPVRYLVSGWITGLFYWDDQGKKNRFLSEGLTRDWDPGTVQYDGFTYGEIALEDIPLGYANAEFLLLNNHNGPDPSQPREGFVAAGSIGMKVVPGAPPGYEAARQSLNKVSLNSGMQSTIQPLSGWVLAAPPPDPGYRRSSDTELTGRVVDAIDDCEREPIHMEL